jgi:hypothetical protein
MSFLPYVSRKIMGAVADDLGSAKDEQKYPLKRTESV